VVERHVSVIIPCYNLGQYLDDAVASVLAQTYRHFEILIVDDGSTEPATRAILDAYSQRGTRIVRTENRGLPAAKNLGLAETTGPYVCVLDADDLIDPCLFEKSLQALEREPSVAFVSHWLRAFGDEQWDWTPTRCDFPSLLDTNTVNGAAIVRREALVAVGGFDESMRDGCEDWDLWIGLVERGLTGVILPEFLFHYRRRAGSMSRLMLEGKGHPALYRQLVEKHPQSYRQHLPQLLSRRDQDVAHLNRQIEDLEFEQPLWLHPEVARYRDDVALLEHRVARAEHSRAVSTELARLAHALQDTERTLSDAKSGLVSAEAGRLEAFEALERTAGDRDRLAAEAAKLERHVTKALEALEQTAGDRDRLAVEVAKLERQVTTQSTDIEAGRCNLAIAVDRAHDLDARAHAAETALGDVRGSVSWRATAPLRALYRVCRRLLGLPA
jgi:hypothetical protein